MTKFERTKLWVKTHQDTIIVVGVGTVVVALVVVGVKANMTYQEQLTSELNGYIDSLNELYATTADSL